MRILILAVLNSNKEYKIKTVDEPILVPLWKRQARVLRVRLSGPLLVRCQADQSSSEPFGKRIRFLYHQNPGGHDSVLRLESLLLKESVSAACDCPAARAEKNTSSKSSWAP